MDRGYSLYISGFLRIYIMNECGLLLNDYPTCNEIIMTVKIILLISWIPFIFAW